MKKIIIKGFSMMILLLGLTGCGIANSDTSPATDGNSDTSTAKPISIKTVRNPQDITNFCLSDDFIQEGKPFQYQNQKYQIKEYRSSKKTDLQEDDILYWTLSQIHSQEQKDSQKQTDRQQSTQNQEIPLVDPQEIPLLDSLEKQELTTCYMLDYVFLLSDYLFYSCQECITKPFGKNGAEYDWGKSMLCRINLETMEIDQSYTLATKKQEKAGNIFRIWGADPDSGYIYLSKNGNLLVLDFSLEEVDMAAFDSSEHIMDIDWQEEGYVLTDAGIYQINLALNKRNQLEKPKFICTWPSDSFESYAAKAIGTYGRFLYGYTYEPANYTIVGHYFQVDLDGKRCKILSADQKKSFSGEYDQEICFDTESFADKHELYSEGRDNSDHSWDPIQVCYILSEDGSVEIKTEKIKE